MRLIKAFGLVAIVAALMAIVEAGSAGATTQLEKVVWCKARTVQTCAAGNDFPAGTEIFAGATSPEFLSNLGNVSCAASEINMTNTGLLVHGNVTALVFSECEHEGGEKCDVSSKNTEYLFKGELVTDDANSKYEVRFTEKAPNGPPQITFECGMVIDCTYSAKTVSIEAKLAFTPERLSVLQEFIVTEGFFCAKNMTWHGTYGPQCREKVGSEVINCWVKMENT
jgi:hypothetical protein